MPPHLQLVKPPHPKFLVKSGVHPLGGHIILQIDFIDADEIEYEFRCHLAQKLRRMLQALLQDDQLSKTLV